MWSDDKAIVVRHFREEMLEQFFIGRPSATRDDALAPINEVFDIGKSLSLLGDGRYTVEACVATHGDLLQAMLLKQLSGSVVLNEEMRHIVEKISGNG